MLLFFLCNSDHYPRASLTLQTGQPVMQSYGSVTLTLDHSNGLQGWKCFVSNGHRTNLIVLGKKGDNVSLEFQTNILTRPENIFWCSSADERKRSNQVTIRTSSRCSNLQIRLCSSNMGRNEDTVCIFNPLQVGGFARPAFTLSLLFYFITSKQPFGGLSFQTKY